MEVVASPSQGRTAAAQCGLFTYKSVPVKFEPTCTKYILLTSVKKVIYLLYVEYLPKSFKCRVEGEHLMWTMVVERHWLVRSATYVGWRL